MRYATKQNVVTRARGVGEEREQATEIAFMRMKTSDFTDFTEAIILC